jgi:hypothetical protein
MHESQAKMTPSTAGFRSILGTLVIVAKANNLDMDDTKLAPIVRTRVNNALYRYMNKGEVSKMAGRGSVNSP